MSARRLLWILGAVALLAGVAFHTLRSLNSPTWDVWVTDETGHPLSGATVRLSYQIYSAERESHEIDAVTDTQGHASFGPQILSASLGCRVIATVASARAGVHASFGPHAYVTAFGKGLLGLAIDEQSHVIQYWTGKSTHMETRIVLKPLTR